MDLRQIQDMTRDFEEARGWDKFPASQVFAHLIEELGEISRHITVEEGYKVIGLGHESPDDSTLSREFAQVFSLLVQLANHYKIDLEQSVLSELERMESRFPEKEWKDHMRKQ
ncbi:MAG: MazG nucleotide pyrophosphohydrolase domain-containing protein [Candidatus Thorarchaeota archaeon]|jgi:NTP pyrophosphatase (non-canonical NTP hydrolase)